MVRAVEADIDCFVVIPQQTATELILHDWGIFELWEFSNTVQMVGNSVCKICTAVPM